jgi:hypothetical protein
VIWSHFHTAIVPTTLAAVATVAAVPTPEFNWGAVVIALIAAVPPTLVAAAAYLQAAAANRQAKEATAQAGAAHDQTVDTRKAVDGRMTEMLEITRKLAGSEATLTEKNAEQVRKGDAAIEAAKLNKEGT